jgi:pimeloyl-ACP methyl ester carboxylesterase
MPPIQQICQTRGVGQYLPGERHNIWFHRLDPFAPNAKTGVILAHGWLGNADYFTEYYDTTPPIDGNDAKAKEIVQRIALQQLPAIATDMGGTTTTWGNDTAISACASSLTYLNTVTGARTDRAIVVGLSMGALTALNWARANPSKVAAIGLFLPTVNLADMHDNNRGGFAGDIEASYGGASGYATDGPSHDPANFTASYASMPIRIWYSSDDPVAVPSVVTAFGTAVGATMTNLGNVGHSNNSLTNANLDAEDVAEWFAQYA